MKKYAIWFALFWLGGCTPGAYHTKIDYGDFTPRTLAAKSWAALDHRHTEGVWAYTGKCLELYAQAGRVVNAMPPDVLTVAHKESELLSNVAQCFLVRGEALFQQKDYNRARWYFQAILHYYDKSEVRDASVWKPSEFARQRLLEIDRVKEQTEKAE